MNRRQLLQTAPAALGAVWFGDAAAQGTPVASPAGTPLAVPGAYADVAPEYDQLAGVLLEQGRTVAELALSGDNKVLYDRFSPDMQAAISLDTLGTLLPAYTTNRAHFEVADFQLVFDAQVTGDTMTGLLQSGGQLPFSLRTFRGNAGRVPGGRRRGAGRIVVWRHPDSRQYRALAGAHDLLRWPAGNILHPRAERA